MDMIKRDTRQLWKRLASVIAAKDGHIEQQSVGHNLATKIIIIIIHRQHTNNF